MRVKGRIRFDLLNFQILFGYTNVVEYDSREFGTRVYPSRRSSEN